MGDASPPVEMTLPDDTTVRSDDPDVHARLSAALGRDATLWSRRAVDDLDLLRRREPIDLAEMRRQYGLLDGTSRSPTCRGSRTSSWRR